MGSRPTQNVRIGAMKLSSRADVSQSGFVSKALSRSDLCHTVSRLYNVFTMADNRALIIANPIAGGGHGLDELKQGESLLRSAGWDVVTKMTGQPGEATTLAYSGTLEGFDMILAAGGDGTVGQVVDGIVSAPGEPAEKPMLGILPMGTGNVLAKDLGYPIPNPVRPFVFREAIQKILDGKVFQVDVGRANGKHFLSWCGVGFDAKVAQEVESHPEQKRLLGKAAFVIAGMMILNTYVGHKATVLVDGETVTRRVIMVLISNIQLYARFVRIAHDAKLDDGLLDIYLFEGEGGFSVIKHGFTLLFRPSPPFRPPSMLSFKGKHIEILSKEPIPVHLDAEPHGNTPLTVDVVPRALRLIIPDVSERLLSNGESQQQGSQV